MDTSSSQRTPLPCYTWARRVSPGEPHLEVSSKGDKRFSAFYARLRDGRTIEHAYQVDVKGHSSIRAGKGCPPRKRMTREAQWNAYLDLWRTWAAENPELIGELATNAVCCPLTDCFASTDINQARALATILNERYGK